MKNRRLWIAIGILFVMGCVLWFCRPRSDRYSTQTVTYKTRVLPGGKEIDYNATLKIDKQTGRTWVLKGGTEPSTVHFGEIREGDLDEELADELNRIHEEYSEKVQPVAKPVPVELWAVNDYLEKNIDRLVGKPFESYQDRYRWKVVYMHKMIDLSKEKQYADLESLARAVIPSPNRISFDALLNMAKEEPGSY